MSDSPLWSPRQGTAETSVTTSVAREVGRLWRELGDDCGDGQGRKYTVRGEWTNLVSEQIPTVNPQPATNPGKGRRPDVPTPWPACGPVPPATRYSGPTSMS